MDKIARRHVKSLLAAVGVGFVMSVGMLILVVAIVLFLVKIFA